MRQLISELQGYMATAFEAWVDNQGARFSMDGSGEPRPKMVTSFQTFNAAKEGISQVAEAIRDQAGDELSDRRSGEAEGTPG